jgi:hypothetical protein
MELEILAQIVGIMSTKASAEPVRAISLRRHTTVMGKGKTIP